VHDAPLHAAQYPGSWVAKLERGSDRWKERKAETAGVYAGACDGVLSCWGSLLMLDGDRSLGRSCDDIWAFGAY
jgi:hypothetical protein